SAIRPHDFSVTTRPAGSCAWKRGAVYRPSTSPRSSSASSPARSANTASLMLEEPPFRTRMASLGLVMAIDLAPSRESRRLISSLAAIGVEASEQHHHGARLRAIGMAADHGCALPFDDVVRRL